MQGPWPRPLFPELLSDGRDVIVAQTPLRLFLVVPEGHVAVASGKMLECRAHGSSQRRYEYLVAQPATPSIAAGALHGRWHRAPAKPGDPCIVLHAPQSAVECLEATAAFLGLLNDCYSDKLLVPLPLEEYTQVGVLLRLRFPWGLCVGLNSLCRAASSGACASGACCWSSGLIPSPPPDLTQGVCAPGCAHPTAHHPWLGCAPYNLPGHQGLR